MDEAINQAMNEVAALGTIMFVTLLLAMILCGALGALVGSQKRAGLIGGMLDFLLGPLGVLVAAFLDQRPLCPRCGGRLNGEPQLCPACQSALQWLDGRPFARTVAARRIAKAPATDPAEDTAIEAIAAATLGCPRPKTPQSPPPGRPQR